MSEYRDTLKRELERLRPPRIPLDELVGRRDRKRREQRIRAAVLGIAIAVAVGWWGFHTILSTRPKPADPTPKPSALRQDGENVAIERLGAGSGWSLAAQDPRTGNFREIGSLDGIVDCPNDSYVRCTNFANRAEW